MVRRCSDKLAKTLMVVFNLVFLVCGITIVVVALTADHPKSIDGLVQGLKNVNYYFLAVGVFISFMAFLGCCGAWRESSCMINAFLVLLVAILVAEIAVVGLAFYKRNNIEEEVRREGLERLKKQDDASKHILDDIQTSLHCCGINDYTDYTVNNITIPPSCCKGTITCTKDSPEIFSQGCYIVVSDKIKSNLFVVGTIAIVIAFIEVLGLIFACCLRGAINERYESV